MKKRKAAVCYLMCMCSMVAAAQTNPADTTVQLSGFTKTTDRYQAFNTGVKVSKADSLLKHITAQNNIAQLLSYSTPVFVKTYGPGQLSTTSFRGAGAEHTAILWNGINLQSNMHGQLDFSQIPAGFMDDVDIYYGGNSALYGAGAVGGAVVLGNKPVFNKKLSANYQAGAGSFGMLQHRGGVEYGSNRFYIKARTFNTSAENNFGYYDYTLADKPLRYRKHADLYATGSIFETGYRINAKNELNLRYWYNYNNANIPPTIGMGINHAFQIDENHRVGAEWKYTPGQRSRFIVRAAYLTERLDFEDPSTYLSGRSRSKNAVAEAEHFYQLSKSTSINTGVNYAYFNATSESYTRHAQQNRIAVFASARSVLFKKLTASASIRQELIDGARQPFTASGGLNYELKKWIALTAHVNKSYRVPTFNDLYWITGNPALKPENGFGQELGINTRVSDAGNFLTVQLNAFNRNVTNWITWQPTGGVWTPQNLKEVWSRGGELSIKYTRMISKIMLTLKSDVSYVLSTNEKSIYANDASVGKQLIYIPRLTHQSWITITWKKLYLAYNNTYTGYRFTSTDNSSFLNEYNLGNVFAGYGYNYKKTGFDLRLQYNNIANTVYEVLPAKPMPLSNYLITLTIKLNT